MTLEEYRERFGKEPPDELMAFYQGKAPAPTATQMMQKVHDQYGYEDEDQGSIKPTNREEINVYIGSKVWKDRRDRYLSQNKITRCQGCGVKPSEGKPLQVHHASYREAGNGLEPDSHLWALCYECHMSVHKKFAKKYGLWKGTMRVLMTTEKYRKLK